MKIIHCADIHLGSRMDSHMPIEKVRIRRTEIRNTFLRLVEFAKQSEVRHILLAGDIFDGERPLKADREFFYNIISGSPDISFYYLRGNHDLCEDYSSAGLENLKTFSEEWRTYDIGQGISVTGCEIGEGNSLALYNTLSLDRSRINIVMLHGQVSSSIGTGLIYPPALTDKGIDYLALGHVHSFSAERLDGRGVLVYSGCLEGRGFDECGEKGFALLDIKDGAVNYEFTPFAERRIRSMSVDVKEADGLYSLLSIIRNRGLSPEDIVRVELVGECDFDLTGISDSLTRALEPYCFFARVKSRAQKRIDLTMAERELSLRGEFIRTVMRSHLTDGEKSEVIALGVRALSGEDI